MLFLVLMVMSLVAGFQMLGTLMSVGLMVPPVITVRPRARNMGGLILASLALTLVCRLGGLLFSYHVETPSGPATILWRGALYLFSMVSGEEGGVLTKWLKHRKYRTA